ncbi:MAG: glucokinase [Deltaproteobacteria bacterium]|nr:glucokinase [Deltaproteobacteria bacterium]
MTKSVNEEYVLAGDIGGTKTSLGIFVKGKSRPLLKQYRSYPSRDFKGLEEIIALFLSEYPFKTDNACFGVAGPVEKGRCKTTNFPWEIHAERIKDTFRFQKISLVNDLSAMAASVPYLTRSEIFTLNPARPEKRGNISVIAPGTGLGQALLVYSDSGYIPVPSEGGHVDFAPGSDLEAGLLKYLRKEYGHVSLERIISGIGILNIYNYLKISGKYSEPAWLSKKISGDDPAKVINEAACQKGQKLCLKTVDTFLSILGAAAGNLALTGLTKGGVYIGGGIPPKMLWRLKENTFMKAFVNKGRFSGLMQKIPVHVVLNSNAALLGAAIEAFNIRSI